MKTISKSVFVLALLLIVTNIYGYDLDHVTVWWTQNGSLQSHNVAAAGTYNISRDPGTDVDVRIYKSSSAPTPSTFSWLAWPVSSGDEVSSYNTYVNFDDVAPAGLQYVQCMVNVYSGNVKIYVTDLPAQYPDLSPQFLKLDGHPYQAGYQFSVGETITASCQIINTGDVQAGSSRVGFYLGTSSTDYSEMYDYENTTSLDPDEIENEESDEYTFTTNDIGTRYLNFFADYDHDVEEGTAEGNNKQSWGAFTVVGAPIADIVDISYDPAGPINPSDPFILSIYVKNIGSLVSSEGGISVSFPDVTLPDESGITYQYNSSQAMVVFQDATTLPTKNVYGNGTTIWKSDGTSITDHYLLMEAKKTNWAVNEGQTMCLMIWPKEPGIFNMKIRCWLSGSTGISRDPNASGTGIGTDQQGYYTYEKEITVNNVSPDLTVTALNTPATSEPGVTHQITVSVQNIGTMSSPVSPGQIRISNDENFDNGTFLANYNFSAISPGQTVTSPSFPVTIPPSGFTGNCYLIYKTNYDNSFPESNTTNNFLVKPITIGVAPTFYTISGTAKSDLNTFDRIPGAVVTVDDNPALTATTDWEGRYVINDIPAGTHTVTIAHIGYTWEESSYSLNIEQNTVQDFQGHCNAMPQVTYTIPATFTPGVPFDITVKLKNIATAIQNVSAYLDVSFPDFSTPTTAVSFVSQNGFDGDPSFKQAGENICRVDMTNGTMDCNYPANYLLVSAVRTGTIFYNQEWAYTLRVTPPEISTFTIHIKGSIGDQRDPNSGTTGQQGLWEQVIEVNNLIIGLISGTITDHETGLPLHLARVIVNGGSFTSEEILTGDDGNFTIGNVPFGTGYTVTAVRSGYETGELTGVNINQSEPSTNVLISLYPLSGSYFIQEINPNPNPSVSTVFQGGKCHRYYKIVNDAGLACPDVIVVVQSQNGTLYDDDFITDAKGVVDISLGNNDVGSLGQTKSFNIIKINNHTLTSPISFNVQVTSPEYSKFWGTTGFAEIGATFCILNLNVEMERASVLTVVEEDAGNGIPEYIDCQRQGKAGGGVGFKVKSPEVSCNLGVIQGKAGAEAGAGVKFIGITEDNYRFGYNSASNYEAIAKYIIAADGGFNMLDNTLIRLLTVCEDWFTNQNTLNEVFVSDVIGLDVIAHAEAEAEAGVGVPNLIGVGAGANIGAEGHVTFRGINHYQENQKEFEFGISGKVQGSAEAGIKIDYNDAPPLQEVKTMLQIYDISSMRGISFSVIMNSSTNAIEAYKICLTKKNSVQEEKITYTISGPQAISEIGDLESEISNLNQSSSAASSVNVGNSTFNRIIDQVFSFLFNVQGGNPNGASVTYTKELTPIQHSSAFTLGVSLGISFVDAEIGGGGEFEEGASMTVTEGKWIYGHHFPTTTYSGTIPNIPIDHQEVLQQIIDDLPLSLRVLIGVVNFFTGGVKNQNFYIGDQGSYIVIPDGAVPSGVDTISCTSWSWYGTKISDRFDNINDEFKKIYKDNRKSAENIYGMKYGIGGFYQFEPYNTTMLDTCILTIKYTQDELQGVEESSLAVYCEDKANHTWQNLGGVVDAVENTVTVPVTFLSLFTLAPTQPYGGIGLNPSADSLFADSISTLTVLSDLIFNNDSSLVMDDELFTVYTSLGQILATDKDTLTGGIQVAALGGRIQFAIRSSAIAGDASIFAFSLRGSARGDTTVVFYDTIAPGYPLNLKGIAGNGCAYLKWQRNPEKDIAGYKIYFDSDVSGVPYNGHASVFGLSSPIISGTDTNYTVYGLYNDSSYYFTIKAYDVAGNESAYSNEVFLNLRIPDTLYVGNTTIQLRDTTCFNATEYLYVPTQYNFFVVDSGGSVTLVAGEKISLNTGFSANNGSYFHAYITTDNNFCAFTAIKGFPHVQPVDVDDNRLQQQVVVTDKQQLFHIYPNPTSDQFNLELSAEFVGSTVNVKVFNMFGQEVLHQQINGRQKTAFSLENQSPGIYMVSVMLDGKMEMVKVVKY